MSAFATAPAEGDAVNPLILPTSVASFVANHKMECEGETESNTSGPHRSYPERPRQDQFQQEDTWSLSCASIGGGNSIRAEVQPTMLGTELHKMIADMLGVQAYTFLLLHGDRSLEGNSSLHHQGVNDNALITRVELDEPVKHNGIHQCDSCAFQRFCHSVHTFFGGEPERVIALCEPCGGTPAPGLHEDT